MKMKITPLTLSFTAISFGNLFAEALNEDLDSIVIMMQQIDEKVSRALQVDIGDTTASLTLPLPDIRKGKLLGFNSSTGEPEAFFEPPDRITISTDAPSGGSDGDIWFRVSS